jgi:hypothetical protein
MLSDLIRLDRYASCRCFVNRQEALLQTGNYSTETGLVVCCRTTRTALLGMDYHPLVAPKERGMGHKWQGKMAVSLRHCTPVCQSACLDNAYYIIAKMGSMPMKVPW